MKIDDIDKKIINELIGNARQSYRQLSQKIGVSVATVMHRVNRLEKSKVIRHYSAILDYDQLGFDVQVIVDIRIAKGKLFEVEKKIATIDNVYALYDNTGSFDATIIGKFPNRKAMDAFLKKVQSYDFVERTETKLILNTIKEQGIKT